MPDEENDLTEQQQRLREKLANIASGCYGEMHWAGDRLLNTSESADFADTMARAIELLESQLMDAGLCNEYSRITSHIIRLDDTKLITLVREVLNRTIRLFQEVEGARRPKSI
jgi:hypothetical protein